MLQSSTGNHLVDGADADYDRYTNGTCDCGRILNGRGECGWCNAQQDKVDQIQQEG